MSFLDFRDSIFPYIGLIVTIVVFMVTIIPAFLLNQKKTLYWALGNLIGYYFGWLLLFLIGHFISAALSKLIVPSNSNIDPNILIPLFNEIIPLLWFFSFLLIWNLGILLPNYLTWYKNIFIRKNVSVNQSRYKNQIKIKISMVLISAIAYAPIVISTGSLVQSFTTSQSHANKTSKGVSNMYDALSVITYTNQTRINLDALQGMEKMYNSNVVMPDGSSKHPYEFIKSGFDEFFSSPTSDLPTFKEYITNNFIKDDIISDDVNAYFYVKWISNDYFGNPFYQNRTVSSLASQFMLPKTLMKAIPEILSNYINVKTITYYEITDKTIKLDYTNPEDPTIISLENLMQYLVDGTELTITVPDESITSQKDYYHLRLLKDDLSDFRIKILHETYNNLCTKITNEIISHDDDMDDYDKMLALSKNYLGKIFFIDQTPNGTLYTNPSQISNSF